MDELDENFFEKERERLEDLSQSKFGFDPCTGAYIGIDELGKKLAALEKRVAALEKK